MKSNQSSEFEPKSLVERKVEALPRRFNPDMLTLARNSRGFTQTELARELGITQGRVSKIEDGLALNIPTEVLEDISRVLRYPVQFFQQTENARAACASFYRKKSSLPASILNKCDARMNIQRIHIEKLMRAAELESKPLPYLDPIETDGGPRAIAAQIRAFWGIPSGPIRELTRIVEDAGCIVVHFDFETNKLDGLSLFTNEGTPVVFINKSFPADRLRFTLAHELGHLIMHRVPTATMEEEAHAFASEFLMPEADIRSQLYPVTLDHLARLKLSWQVSMGSLIKRAHDLGVITDRGSQYMWMQMGRLGYRLAEPHSELIKREEPSLLRELIALHLTELEYTAQELCISLGLTESEYNLLYGVKKGEFKVVE